MLLPFALLLFVGAPLLVHEVLRLRELHNTCTQHWIENALLLQHQCATPAGHTRGAKLETVCREAEAENAVSPEACALREIWRQGAAYRLWDSVVGSPWTLFGVLCTLLALCFLAWQASAQRAFQERMYERTLREVTRASPPVLAASPLPPPPPPPPIQFIMPDSQHHYMVRRRLSYDYLPTPRLGEEPSRVDL